MEDRDGSAINKPRTALTMDNENFDAHLFELQAEKRPVRLPAPQYPMCLQTDFTIQGQGHVNAEKHFCAEFNIRCEMKAAACVRDSDPGARSVTFLSHWRQCESSPTPIQTETDMKNTMETIRKK